ncbi:hypothetical protein VTO73DRAFT_8019 [Trametes versicolor]
MKSCRLALKTCKQVIHAVRSISPDYDTLREETQAVLACALVCRDWREVSQSVLWEAVAIRTDEQIERLIDAFERKPSSERGDPSKVHTLCTLQSKSGIQPSAGSSGQNNAVSTEKPGGTRANPATTKLRDLLVKLGSTDLRTLDLNAVIWTEWPTRLDNFWQWPFAQSLEELRLNGCAFVKADDLIDIAWACAKLQRLVIRQSNIREDCHKMGKYSKGRPGPCKTHAPTRSTLQEASGLLGYAASPPRCTCKLTELKALHLSDVPFNPNVSAIMPLIGPAVKKIEVELDEIVLTATSSPKPDTLSSNIGDSKDIEAFSAHPDLQMSLLAALHEATPHLRWVLIARSRGR